MRNSESEEEHRELVDFCKDFKFERMGTFVYSEEEGTPAGERTDQIDPDVREARRDELNMFQQQIQMEFAEQRVGTEVMHC